MDRETDSDGVYKWQVLKWADISLWEILDVIPSKKKKKILSRGMIEKWFTSSLKENLHIWGLVILNSTDGIW